MKLSMIIWILILSIHHAACMTSDENQSIVPTNTMTSTVVRPVNYYSLPMHLRQHIADFAGINSPNKQGWLPLQTAVASCKPKKSLFLLQHGANPRATNIAHPTSPLSFAASFNYSICQDKEKEQYYRIFKHLLYHDVNPYTFDEFGQTAIHNAVISHNIAALTTIIKTNLNINIKNKNDQTPYDLAKILAMHPKNHPEHRKNMYTMCAMFDRADAQSSVILQPIRPDKIMMHQLQSSKK
jgi:ankyrin repeat protein